MADKKNQNLDDENFGRERQKATGAAAGAHDTESQRMKAQTGGAQSDQLSGQSPQGAFNQDRENRNPSGNNPDRQRSGRQQEGEDL
jgi:hypothetical protein